MLARGNLVLLAWLAWLAREVWFELWEILSASLFGKHVSWNGRLRLALGLSLELSLHLRLHLALSLGLEHIPVYIWVSVWDCLCLKDCCILLQRMFKAVLTYYYVMLCCVLFKRENLVSCVWLPGDTIHPGNHIEVIGVFHFSNNVRVIDTSPG